MIPIAPIALWPARRDDSISVSDLMLVRQEYKDRPNKTENGLHRALARGIVSDKTPMDERELRFLRKLVRLSEEDLAHLLG
jgi:hypothetical protein